MSLVACWTLALTAYNGEPPVSETETTCEIPDSPLPRVPISDRAAVSAAVQTHGYAILTDLAQDKVQGSSTPVDWAQVTLGLAQRVVPPEELLSDGASTLHSVHEENAKMSEQFLLRQAECKKANGGCEDAPEWSEDFTNTAGQPLLPHTDGYVYGDHLPDLIFLLVEASAEQGGENFLVDGEAVLRRLQRTANGEALAKMAYSAHIDLTERLSAGGITTGREAFGPLFRRRENGGLWWRRMLRSDAYEAGIQRQEQGRPARMQSEPQPYQSLWTPAVANASELEHEAVRAMLVAVDTAVQQEAVQARRFLLQPGEALVRQLLTTPQLLDLSMYPCRTFASLGLFSQPDAAGLIFSSAGCRQLPHAPRTRRLRVQAPGPREKGVADLVLDQPQPGVARWCCCIRQPARCGAHSRDGENACQRARGSPRPQARPQQPGASTVGV